MKPTQSQLRTAADKSAIRAPTPGEVAAVEEWVAEHHQREHRLAAEMGHDLGKFRILEEVQDDCRIARCQNKNCIAARLLTCHGDTYGLAAHARCPVERSQPPPE